MDFDSNISNNAADFSKSLMALCSHVDGSIEKVIRKSCIDLYRRIVERTPVDTGRAKASWSISTVHADDVQHDPDGFSYNEIATIVNNNVSDFSVSVHDNQVVIYNNLEYISELENGTSDQAPTGMVAISLSEFTEHFNNALQDIEGVL